MQGHGQRALPLAAGAQGAQHIQRAYAGVETADIGLAIQVQHAWTVTSERDDSVHGRLRIKGR
jgi:hypothetical protein